MSLTTTPRSTDVRRDWTSRLLSSVVFPEPRKPLRITVGIRVVESVVDGGVLMKSLPTVASPRSDRFPAVDSAGLGRPARHPEDRRPERSRRRHHRRRYRVRIRSRHPASNSGRVAPERTWRRRRMPTQSDAAPDRRPSRPRDAPRRPEKQGSRILTVVRTPLLLTIRCQSHPMNRIDRGPRHPPRCPPRRPEHRNRGERRKCPR